VKVFLTNIMLAIVWTFLTGHFTYTNIIIGFVIGYIAILISRPQPESSKYLKKIPNVISFMFFFLWELIKANMKVAHDVSTPRNYMRPGVVSFPLEVKSDLEITLFMNLITLTPGTLSLDVSTDRKLLYIHAMYIDDVDEFRNEMKYFERRLLGVLR
jgi:multicomponent Na+:H+ antiporter subunit E